VSTGKGGYVSILFVCSSLARRPRCVYYCYWCYYYCCKCYELSLLSIQSSYMSPSVNGCSSTYGNLVSCSLLTFCLCSLICLWYGDDICGILAFYLPACTNVGTIDGATLPFINFWTLAFTFSYSFLFLDLEATPSSIPLENTPWRLRYNFSLVFQCCLNFLSSSFDLGLCILWIFISVDKQIFKNLCQNEGWLICVLLVSFNLLDIFVPPIQLITQTIVHNLHPQPYRTCNVIILLTCPFESSTYPSTQNPKTFIINYLLITYTLS